MNIPLMITNRYSIGDYWWLLVAIILVVIGGYYINGYCALLHIVPFCEGPNKKPEGFAKQKQPAIFAMRHASHLVVHQPSLIYNVH